MLDRLRDRYRELVEPINVTCNRCGQQFATRYPAKNVCDQCVREARLTAQLEEHAAWLREAGLEGELVDMNLATFDWTRQPDAWAAVRQALDTWPKPYNLALLGEVGCGKSHIAAGLARWLLDRGYGVLFVHWPTLWKTIDDAQDRGATEHRLLEPLKRVRCLVIDDAGRETATAAKKQWQDIIFNSRWLLKLPTVVTANLTADSLEKWLGDAATSRFMAFNSNVVELEPGDARLANLEPTVHSPWLLPRHPSRPCGQCGGGGCQACGGRGW